MENQTRWVAKWIDRMGNKHEFTFSGPSSRAIAGVDFKLECIAAGEPVPAHFELEEGTMVLSTLPKHSAAQKRSESLRVAGKLALPVSPDRHSAQPIQSPDS